MKKVQNALSMGYKFPNYVIDSILGCGGFSIVYKARHRYLEDRWYAIKEYLPVEFAVRKRDSRVVPKSDYDKGTYEWGLASFLDEARTLNRFDHPNIVRVEDFFKANDTAYMVMKFEAGQDFKSWLQARSNPPDEATLLQIFAPLVDGLQFVHSEHYLHRDIKPANIYIRADGSPMLIDFGVARLALGDKSLTVVASPGFAPKEQYSSNWSKQGAWTDVYALAASLYYAISGYALKKPEKYLPMAADRGDARDDGEADPLAPALQIGFGRYNRHFLAGIDHGLAYLPRERPQKLVDFWEALTNAKKNPPPPLPPSKPSSKMPWIVGGIVASVLISVGATYYFTKIPKPIIALDEPVPPITEHIPEIIAISAPEQPLKPNFPMPSMVQIPAGSFEMGCLSKDNDCQDDEKNIHTVQIKAFHMSQHEVTVKQYLACVTDKGCDQPEWLEKGSDYNINTGKDDHYKQLGAALQADNHPIVGVSWNNANQYTTWLSKKTSENYRLPTEAEWEYAARAGTTTKYFWGNKIGKNKANCNSSCKDDYKYTSPVGTYAKNPWDLYDMHGNVWEWTCSIYKSKYNGSEKTCADDNDKARIPAVLRGGSWNNKPNNLRSADRSNDNRDYRFNRIGFRISRTD